MSNKPQLLLVLFLVVVTASAAIYKWVDEKGVTQYSETPPSKQKSQKIQMPSTSPPVAAEDDKPAFKTRQERNKSPGNVLSNTSTGAPEGEERCLKARKRLAILQQQLAVYRDKEGKLRAHWKYDTYKGEREYISDATRTSEIERVRQEIAMNCPNPNDAEAQNLARKKWIKSEYCASARADLEALEQPEAKATQQDLREKRQKVESYCKE